MFILTKISDLVQISPEDFQKPSVEAIVDNINAKYANKVIQKIGLCICLYDLLKASEGLIGHGTGIVNVNVEFRLVVFRPFKGEIIVGKISSASEQGMKSKFRAWSEPGVHSPLMAPSPVHLEFFHDIFVPRNLLFDNCSFNVQEQCWVWRTESDELFFDKYQTARFRVEEEHWNDQSPTAPADRDSTSAIERKSPYSITASMSHSGLGLIEWW